jgi:hypothetical protein
MSFALKRHTSCQPLSMTLSWRARTGAAQCVERPRDSSDSWRLTMTITSMTAKTRHRIRLKSVAAVVCVALLATLAIELYWAAMTSIHLCVPSLY